MTVMRVRASMGGVDTHSARTGPNRARCSEGVDRTPVENQGPEMLFQDVQEFIYSEGIQYGCSMAQAKNPWLRWSAYGKTFFRDFPLDPEFFCR